MSVFDLYYHNFDTTCGFLDTTYWTSSLILCNHLHTIPTLIATNMWPKKVQCEYYCSRNDGSDKPLSNYLFMYVQEPILKTTTLYYNPILFTKCTNFKNSQTNIINAKTAMVLWYTINKEYHCVPIHNFNFHFSCQPIRRVHSFPVFLSPQCSEMRFTHIICPRVNYKTST